MSEIKVGIGPHPLNAKDAEQMAQMANEETGNCSSKEPFALRVLGDSMEPEFPDGCIIIIEPALTAEPGSYVIAQGPDEDLIFRQLTLIDEQLHLVAVNAGYPKLSFTKKHTIRGIIIQRAGKNRRQHKHYL